MAEDAHTVIVGLGATGLSCARFLAARGERFAVTDSRAAPPGLTALRAEYPDAPLALGALDAALLARASCIVLSPGVALAEPVIQAALARGAEVIGDIELFARAARAPVIAITGSNGKSTVTTLVGAMAAHAGREVRVGGNLGTPALELLTAREPDGYVLELSSFQLETTRSLAAAAAVVLNVSPDHMDRYATLADYAAAKRRVYRGHGLMVLNGDDAAVLAMAEPGRAQRRFTLRAPRDDDEFGLVERNGAPWLAQGATPLIAEADLKIAGRHNTANALAALALGTALDLPMAAMCAALREFTGLAHRTQFVAGRRGVRWYNDSKGTNVGATLAAIEGLPGRLILIAGGDGKGQDFAPLAAPLAHKARAVVLIGRDAPLIEQAIAGQAPCLRAATLEDAVLRAATLAQAGDSVLLSPACASFDMFANYVERGERFTAAVQALPA